MSRLFSPLLKFISVIGLWPNCEALESNFKSAIVVFLAFVSYLTLLGGAILQNITSVRELLEKQHEFVIALSWNIDLIVANSIVTMVLITIAKRKQFQKLLEALDNLNVSANSALEAKYSRISKIVVSWAILVTVMYVGTATGMTLNYWQTAQGTALASAVLGYIISVYPIAIKAAFAMICFITAEEFRALALRVSTLLSLNGKELGSGKPTNTIEEMEQVRKQHQSLCDFVAHLRDVFSPLFLISVPCDLITIIIGSFYYAVNVAGAFMHLFLSVRIADSIIHLFIIFYAADNLNDKAGECFKVIQRGSVRHLPSTAQLQVLLFAVKDFNNCTNVDAAGFFIISRNLVPMIIGSFLTYIIIMLQTYFNGKSLNPKEQLG